jgi:hypothetical protein
LWAHEVHGHLLPRLRSKAEGTPFRIGTKGCSQDEEGRALLLEERAGALSTQRRVEVAVRFQLGRAAQIGPEEACRCAKELLARGVSSSDVARNLTRALRGGGLGREQIYLPAYLRVTSAFAENPGWERFMERGRISVDGARALESRTRR